MSYPNTTESIAQKHDILFSDMRDLFQNTSETLYEDFIHNNDRGQEILSEAFYDRFAPFIYNMAIEKS